MSFAFMLRRMASGASLGNLPRYGVPHDHLVHALTETQDVARGDVKDVSAVTGNDLPMAEERGLASPVSYTASVAALLASIFAQF